MMMWKLTVASCLMATMLLSTAMGQQAANDLAGSSAHDYAVLKDAAEAIATGNLVRAENELQVYLAVHPADYRALNLLGIIRAQQQRDPEAETLFKKAIAAKPDYASSYARLGLLYLQGNRLDQAAVEFREALRLDPSRGDTASSLVTVLRSQARAAVQSGEVEKGLAFLIEARKVTPNNADVLYDFGIVALRMSLFPDALQAFHEELATRKDDPSGAYGLGRAQMGLAKYAEARQTFQHYVQLRPDDASGYYALGLVEVSLSQAEEARRQFEKSIALQPQQTESYFQLGFLDLESRNIQEATRHFERVLQRDPKHAGALTGMGRVAFEQKDYSAATDYLQRAIAVDSSSRQPHYYLGLTYGRMGRKTDSEKELQIASQLEHSDLERQRTVFKLLDPSEVPNSPSAQ
jgi:tetratricopeptide (TPR) repeat protein